MNMTMVSNGGEYSDARLFFVACDPARVLRAIAELNTLAALPGWDGDEPEWWRLKRYRVVGIVAGVVQTEKVWGVSRMAFEPFLLAARRRGSPSPVTAFSAGCGL